MSLKDWKKINEIKLHRGRPVFMDETEWYENKKTGRNIRIVWRAKDNRDGKIVGDDKFTVIGTPETISPKKGETFPSVRTPKRKFDKLSDARKYAKELMKRR